MQITDHPDRDRQFQYIAAQKAIFEAAGLPRISVDTKKKELIGNFKNSGQEWCLNAKSVNDHDFAQEALGKAVPYGIYNLKYNRGYVYVGQSADTPQFAVEAIVRWCKRLEKISIQTQTKSLFSPMPVAVMVVARVCGSNNYKNYWPTSLGFK